jgi:VCBS repeat-containing protein
MESNVATVTLTVTTVNDLPVAVADAYGTDEGTTLTVATPGVLVNDTDADGGTLTAILVTSPTHGTLTLSPNGSFIYVPTAGYHGADTFTYKANDGTADSNTATVSVIVTAVDTFSSWLVYDYRASIKRLDTRLDKVKYSVGAYDQKPNTEAYLDTATATSDSLRGFLLVPICVGCNENGTGTSLEMDSYLYVTRKDDKTGAVWKFGTAVSAGTFAKGVAGRFNENVEDNLQQGPTSLKKLDEAWMVFAFDFLSPDGMTISGPFGVEYLYGFLGTGSVDGNLVQAGFGKVKADKQSSVGVCGGSTVDACFMITSISGSLTGVSTWTYICGPAIWDICSLTAESATGTLLDPSTATVDGSWSVKLNKKVSAAVNSASTDAAKEAILVNKLGGGELIGGAVSK